MFFYIALFLVYIVLTALYPKSTKLGTIMIAVLFFFSAFRGSMVGTDTSHYLEIERILNERTQGSGFFWFLEYVYLYVVRLIFENNYSERWLILFLSIVTFLSLYGVAKRMKLLNPSLPLVFLVLFYCLSLNIARQMAGVSILLYGYTFLLDDKPRSGWKFLLFVILSSMIHSICIIAVISLLCRMTGVNKRALIILVVIVFFINVFSPLGFVEIILSYFTIGNYSVSYADYSGVYQSNIVRVFTVGINIILLLLLFYNKSAISTTTEDNIFLFSILGTVLTLNMHSDVARFELAFTIFQVVYISKLFQSNDKVRLIVWAFIIYNAILSLYFTAQGSGGLIPYYLEFN